MMNCVMSYFFAFGGPIASLALLAIRNLTTFLAAITNLRKLTRSATRL